MLLVGRALPIKVHSVVSDASTPDIDQALNRGLDERDGHPQRRMMQTIASLDDGTVLCFDCGGDLQPAHFGEMSCQLAYAHGCRGMLLAGNCRDSQMVLKMPDFPVFSFGTRPNAFGGWRITEINQPVYLPGHLTHYVSVRPGDFIFGDNDGVQLIPSALVDEVLLRVEDTCAEENVERDQIAAGMPVDEVYRVYGVL
jgi:regulator of RNase E activity RraA